MIQLKIKRNERIAAMTRILCSHPNQIYTLHYFSELFIRPSPQFVKILPYPGYPADIRPGRSGIQQVQEAAFDLYRWLKRSTEGTLVTYQYPVRYQQDPAGGYLYMSDILYAPQQLCRIGEILAARFQYQAGFYHYCGNQGIPVAVMTAFALGCRLWQQSEMVR